MPLIIHHEVKSKQLKAVGQREEGQFSAHCINALSCNTQGMGFLFFLFVFYRRSSSSFLPGTD